MAENPYAEFGAIPLKSLESQPSVSKSVNTSNKYAEFGAIPLSQIYQKPEGYTPTLTSGDESETAESLGLQYQRDQADKDYVNEAEQLKQTIADKLKQTHTYLNYVDDPELGPIPKTTNIFGAPDYEGAQRRVNEDTQKDLDLFADRSVPYEVKEKRASIDRKLYWRGILPNFQRRFQKLQNESIFHD